jgi:hypothetical protein
MRLSGVLYLGGMFCFLLGERIFGGENAMRWALDGVGLLLLVSALVSLARAAGAVSGDQKAAHKSVLGWAVLGLSSLGVYALGSETVVTALKFAEAETESRFVAAIQAVTAIVWLSGTLPFLMSDRVIAVAPEGLPQRKVGEAAAAALSLAFALAMLFPVNYLGNQLNKRWDFGYFKTARPGTSTQGLVQDLSEPVTIYLFFPSSSDVVEEIRTYFDGLSGGNLTVQYVDHAVEPELSKDLKVRDNGYIVLVKGEGDDRQVKQLKIGADFDSAKSKLKKLDEDFRKNLLALSSDKKVAYFTVGHGELAWTGTDLAPDRKVATLKQALEASNYKVKELGLAQGLANEVPDDAGVVFILGPVNTFLPEELASLDQYRRRGGRMLVGLEPGGPDMAGLLTPMGISYDPTVSLANDSVFIPRTQKIVDRLNLVTNKYSTHESVTNLSRNSKYLATIFPGATGLDEIAGAGGKRTVTVRTLPDTFGDLNNDLSFDAATEKRKTWTLALAATGPIEIQAEAAPVEPSPAVDPAAADPKADDKKADDKKADDKKADDKKADDKKADDKKADDKKADDKKEESKAAEEYRAIVVADATWASDPILVAQLDQNVPPANAQFFGDAMAWLTEEAAMGGTVNSEEDVKIQHTKEGQGWLFYGTAFILPFGLLGGGLLRIQFRRKRGAA